MRTDARVAWLFVLTACSVPPPPVAPAHDAAGLDAYREDSGPVLVVDMGPRDAGSDTGVDAPAPDVGSPDAGPPFAIAIDGRFDDTFWATASVVPNDTVVVSPFDGDSLTNLYYGRDQNWLYLGFEGTLTTGDAVVVYVDSHFGDGVSLFGGLGDHNGPVNSVLSLSLTGTAEFQPEWGWGTSAMPHVLGVSDTTIGWRALSANPNPFATITVNERSACTSMGCETAILLAQLGVTPGGYLTLLVRLGRPSVGFSNQTFPRADAATPELVDVPIMVPAAM